MQHRSSSQTVVRIALTAISTALVCAATIIFSIYVPATRGYFNIGETIIYTIALLLGPAIGGFAGGVGAGLADVLLGFYYFAPATLVIKAFEGGIVGFLGGKIPKFGSRLTWRAFTFIIGLAFGTALAIVGAVYYSGLVQLSVGFPPPESPNVIFFVPPEFWYFVGGLATILLTLAGFVLEPEFGWLVFAVLTGGAAMVIGYFLYENFLLFPLFGIEAVAITEVPLNIGQMLIGTIVALPIVKILQRSFPQLKSQK